MKRQPCTKNVDESRNNKGSLGMTYIAGVDVGNNTTEVAIAQLSGNGQVRFLSSSLVRTVGIKGTLSNAMGIIDASGPGTESAAPLSGRT